jgi:ATP-dependent Clp protease ATP-binding subunit ClpC
MFTEPAREAIVCAQDEAQQLGHGTVQVEHLLLGLFSDQDGIAGRVLADFGLTIEPFRELIRGRLDTDLGVLPEEKMRFSPEAKDALQSANRFGLGKPGAEHILIVIVARGDGCVCDILRVLDADPRRIRFETKKLAWPSSIPGAGARETGEVRIVGFMPAESIGELDFGD